MELAAIGRQFAIFCTEREQLYRQCMELKGQLETANKELASFKARESKSKKE
jgi:hypothetical protein